MLRCGCFSQELEELCQPLCEDAVWVEGYQLDGSKPPLIDYTYALKIVDHYAYR